MTPISTAAAHTLDVPGAQLHYEVRGKGPLVVLVGAPMDAAAFAPLAELLATDRTVLTTDPRGHQGSALDDPEQDSTPQLRADDLARLIAHLGIGPAVVFGSSGGAVSALALAESQPDLVTTVIAHEPPLGELLDDRDRVRANTEDLIATYRTGDVVGAWRKFMANANIHMPEPVLQQMFGGEREPRQLASERYWFDHELRGTITWEPNSDVLQSIPARVIIGIGADSTDQLCDRASRALGTAIGVTPTIFPGGHTGFVEDPVAFATRLREVLAATS
ncbi:alpha/beta fold hydrolase [Nocardia sp. CA-119907]|uniref:alpha/beta fold hydrolase n=1 Tax=Nocardia sp. CA-119907 TaxID=3239973 RepID=UPI003D9922CD